MTPRWLIIILLKINYQRHFTEIIKSVDHTMTYYAGVSSSLCIHQDMYMIQDY